MHTTSRYNSEQALEIWLEQWSDWLDSLISSGIATISSEVRQTIRQWSDSAQILGFSQQAKAVHEFLSDDLDSEQKTELFYQLMTQYDLLQRLYYADRLGKAYNNQEK